MRFLSLLVLLIGLAAAAADPTHPSRKLLFFDLWKLDYWDNVELVQGEPKWISEGTYNDLAIDKAGVYFPTVWRTGNEWRMIYSVKWSPFTMMAAHSDDGVHWHPLSVPDAQPPGGKLTPHHVFTIPSGAGGVAYQDPSATDGFRFRIFGRQHGDAVHERALNDPGHRWHELATREGKKRYFSEAVTIGSRDGLHWEMKTGGKWDWGQEDWHPEPPVFAFWNARRNEHTMLVRPGWGDRRQCLRASRDLTHWGNPELLFQPDAMDTAGPVAMYGLPVHPVGNGAGYVGLLWIFHNSSSLPVNSFNQFFGTMDAQLVYSYDGDRFFRGMREPFMRLNPMPEPGCTQIRVGSIVETDETVYIYSEGHRAEHGRERAAQRRRDHSLASLILHTLRKDGWMYLRSRGDFARFQTKPFTLFTPEIRLNAIADYGEIHFQLTDEKSRPLPGFEFEDCLPLRGGSSLSFPLQWKIATLETVTNQVLRLEIRFRNANIYSLEMAHHFLDAQDQWLLQDGKPIPAKLFDY